jgi:RNA polymerase sigma-70 factor (ECF subfamily)
MVEPRIGSDEVHLLRLARQGDAVALGRIIERYEGLIAATVTGILGAGPDVDDIGQETFLRFFGARDRFRGESKIGTYLVRIAINLAVNEIRRRKRNRVSDLESDSSEEPAARDSESSSRRVEAKTLVRTALGRLDPRFRTVIVLRLISGYSIREIAAVLHLPQGTVLSRLSRGQDKLRSIISELSIREETLERRRDL